jgi:carbamoyltransferase
VRNGKIIAAAQQERFSRIKHDQRFPSDAIDYCLWQGGINPRGLKLVAFYDKPFLKFERILETYLEFAPRGWRSFIKAMPLWLKRKFWTKALIQAQVEEFSGEILFCEHHQAHAAAAFYPSPFEQAAILTVDGVGEWATASYGAGDKNKVSLSAELSFPHSLGLLYSAFTYFCGFRVNSGEYKLMGLAPYGEPRYRDLILDELLDLKSDGSLRLNLQYFDFPVGLRMTNDRFSSLFGGPPRKPEGELTQREMDLAASVQAVTEEVILGMARHAHTEAGNRNLCMAGGVALNCVANRKLLDQGPFENIWIQPASGDAGGALGAALLAWHSYLNRERYISSAGDSQGGSLLGPEYAEGTILRILEGQEIECERLSDDDLYSQVADLIAAGKVIGWFQGRMEFGPRALGNRSILGDARSPQMQRLINRKIKFREGFRPFAPAVTTEDASRYFELDRPSPYMLLTAPVRDDRRLNVSEEDRFRSGLDKLEVIRSEIPAVTHVDYSSRVQTVDANANPRFHRLLETMKQRHGCPVVVNTSFNVRGEPIVCSPRDALACFEKTEMDYLVLGNLLIRSSTSTPAVGGGDE